MKYAERKEMMNAFDPAKLEGKGGESYYRYFMVTLMADLCDNIGSLEYKYGEMLKLQQAKTGQVRPTPPTENSRYGGPKA